MTNDSPDQDRISALRAGLIAQVEHTPRRKLVRAKKAGTTAIAVVAGILLVGGAATAAASSAGLWWRADSSPGGLGAQSYQALTEGTVIEGTGSRSIDLPPAPAGSTTLSVQFSCRSANKFSWGVTDYMPSVTCTNSDLDGEFHASYDFAIDADDHQFFIDTKADASWALMFRYAEQHDTDWGVNAQGETFGVEKHITSPDDDEPVAPDLVMVDSIWHPGFEGPGYINESKDGPPQPKNPEDAVGYNDMMEREYPDGYPLPVYEADGVTVIGEFIME